MSELETKSRIGEDLLRGRWFSLTPIRPTHHPALYELAAKDQNSVRWRYRGTMPPFPAFEQSLYAGVMCQFVICPNDDPQRVAGLVVAYNATPQDQHCYLAAQTDSRAGAGAIEGVALFFRYLFRHWPLRKIYLESLEFNVPQYASAIELGLFREEGRLRSHHYFDDRYWDMSLYAVYREDALAFEEKFSLLFPSE
jgi:RimJ/RimL family protein N-acetyltransferase